LANASPELGHAYHASPEFGHAHIVRNGPLTTNSDIHVQ
jgi:hypothetical protein